MSRRPPRRSSELDECALSCIVAIAGMSALEAQSWGLLPPPTPRRDHGMVFDPLAQRLMIAGENQTWVWETASWRPADLRTR